MPSIPTLDYLNLEIEEFGQRKKRRFPFAGDYSGGLGLENKIEPLKLVDEEEESLSPLD